MSAAPGLPNTVADRIFEPPAAAVVGAIWWLDAHLPGATARVRNRLAAWHEQQKGARPTTTTEVKRAPNHHH